jgi:hypothetical protein
MYKISDHSLTPFSRNNQFYCANWPNKWKPFKRLSLKSAKKSHKNRLSIQCRVYVCIIYCLVSNLNIPVDFRKNFKIYYFRLLDLSGVPLSCGHVFGKQIGIYFACIVDMVCHYDCFFVFHSFIKSHPI